jgi:hypothetical protein
MGSAERSRGMRPQYDEAAGKPKGMKKFTASAWEEARGLMWAHRQRLSLGLVLMLVNRAAGLVLPATSKWLMDDVVAKGRISLLLRPVASARRRRPARDH